MQIQAPQQVRLCVIEKLKKEDITLSDWEFEFQQRGEQPILLCDYFCRSFSQYISKILTGIQQNCDYLFTDSNRGYDTARSKKFIIEKLMEKVEDPVDLHKILRDSIEIPKGFNAVADTIQIAIKDISIFNERLAELWEEMDLGFLKVIPWFYYPWYISKEDILTNRVKVGLEKYREQIEEVCNFDDALLALVFPLKKTGFQLEQDEMLKLVILAEGDSHLSSNSEFKAAAQEYLKDYNWLTTFILAPLRPMTYEQLVERVKRAIAESFKEVLALQKKSTDKNTFLAAELMQIFTGDAVLLQQIADARELGYVLTAGIEEAYVASARYLDFMQLVAKRIGVMYEDLKYLLSGEIVEALKNTQQIDPAIITERRHGFVMMIKDGRQKVVYGPEGHAISVWVDEHFSAVDQTIKELKGQTACRGFAVGKARVVSTSVDAHTLVEGEILVCPMTNPDYVSAMRRSAAIVTDEGGLLSHAAIMSREFNKPCVIATKIATNLFKTGDLIEVNANTGLIKILEKGNLRS